MPGSRRAWGWYRLADEWAARVVAEAGIKPGELVFDIGAGDGALTTHLLRTGACVIAVEPHPRRAEFLRARFPAAKVLELDATSLRLPKRPFRVVANPPYMITASLLRQLLASPSGLTSAHLVLQRAAVRRHAVSQRRGFRLSQGMSLPRSAFIPPPQVDSAVLVVRRR